MDIMKKKKNNHIVEKFDHITKEINHILEEKCDEFNDDYQTHLI